MGEVRQAGAMKMLRRTLCSALVGLLMLIIPASATAQEIPPFPASYWGTVKINFGTEIVDAPVDTVVTAVVGGVERGRIVTTMPGWYGLGTDPNLLVQGEIDQDSLVEFYVNGVKADQTALFQSGNVEQVNLTVPGIAGDASGDGKVNAVDITSVERIIALLDLPRVGADANRDGQVNFLDITKVEMIVAGVG